VCYCYKYILFKERIASADNLLKTSHCQTGSCVGLSGISSSTSRNSKTRSAAATVAWSVLDIEASWEIGCSQAPGFAYQAGKELDD